MAVLLKYLFNEHFINTLSVYIKTAHQPFDEILFYQTVFDKQWENKELKQRMRHIAVSLHQCLPYSYAKQITILKTVFPNMDSFGYLENMIFQDFVEVYGLEHFDISMDSLEHFTQNSSSEFAVRAFILRYPTQTMQQMKKWASSSNHQTRRLASEGCRPRLPWAIALKEFKKDPRPIFEILDLLMADSEPYVQKSVANNLNDISKDHSNLVIDVAKHYIGNHKHTNWILKHGCRTLLKNSNKEALDLFGYTQATHIIIDEVNVPDRVKMGEELQFSFRLNSKKSLGKLRIEYSMEFLRQNSRYNTKVFKIAEGIYTQNNKKIFKKYSFKPISSRKYYQGEQRINIIVNGITLTQCVFILE